MDDMTLRRLVAIEVADLSAARTFILNMAATGLIPDTSDVDTLVAQLEGTRKFKNRVARHKAAFDYPDTGASHE